MLKFIKHIFCCMNVSKNVRTFAINNTDSKKKKYYRRVIVIVILSSCSSHSNNDLKLLVTQNGNSPKV